MARLAAVKRPTHDRSTREPSSAQVDDQRAVGFVAGVAVSSGLELVRLSLGAFLTSSGFGGVAAVGAAYWAYRTAAKRLEGDRDIARRGHENAARMAAAGVRAAQELAEDGRKADRDKAAEDDRRARWWETLRWLWSHRDVIDEQAFLEGVQALAQMVETRQQSVMLEIVTKALTPGR